MKEEHRVRQVGEDLPGQARTIRVVIGKEPKAGIQPAALLTRVKHGDIKGRDPGTQLFQRFGKGESLPYFQLKLLDGPAVAPCRRVAADVLECLKDSKPCSS
jgi:hypothetical protein